MPDESDGGRQWIVEPPLAAGEVSIYLSGAEGTELTHEQEAALGALLQSLELGDSEVAGFDADCPKNLCQIDSGCTHLKCSKVSCGLWCTPMSSNVGASSPSNAWDLMGTFSPRAS